MVFKAPVNPSTSSTALMDVDLDNRTTTRQRTRPEPKGKEQQSPFSSHHGNNNHQQFDDNWQRTSDFQQLNFFSPPPPLPLLNSGAMDISRQQQPYQQQQPHHQYPYPSSNQPLGYSNTPRRIPVPDRPSPLHSSQPHQPYFPPHHPLGASSPSSTGPRTTVNNPLDLDQYQPYPQLPNRVSSVMPSPSSPASKATLNHNSYNNTLNGINSTNSMNNNYYQPPQNTYDRQSGSPIGYQPPPPPNHPPPQPSSLPRSYSSPISPSTTLRHNSTLPSSSASIRSEKSSSSSRLQKIAQTRHRIYKNPFRKYNDDGTLRFLTYREIEMKGLGELAQFSNERLYLHWIRFGVLQGGIAVMLLSFGIGVAAYVGVGALLLTSMTLVYATTLYHKRHLYMRAKRQDVDYYARTTPTLLTLGLLVLYAANFALQLSFGEEARSPPPWTADDKGNYKNV